MLGARFTFIFKTLSILGLSWGFSWDQFLDFINFAITPLVLVRLTFKNAKKRSHVARFGKW